MLPLPDPTAEPKAFLMAMSGQADPAAAARAAGCVVHVLAGQESAEITALAGLHGAGARAIAASLAIGAAPIMLLSQGGLDHTAYATALTTALMGYERIHTAISHDNRMILILPAVELSAYWRKG